MPEIDASPSAVPRLQPGTYPGGGVPLTDELPEPWQSIVESVESVLRQWSTDGQ